MSGDFRCARVSDAAVARLPRKRLGCQPGAVPGTSSLPAQLESPSRPIVRNRRHFCDSFDSFETRQTTVVCEIVCAEVSVSKDIGTRASYPGRAELQPRSTSGVRRSILSSSAGCLWHVSFTHVGPCWRICPNLSREPLGYFLVVVKMKSPTIVVKALGRPLALPVYVH